MQTQKYACFGTISCTYARTHTKQRSSLAHAHTHTRKYKQERHPCTVLRMKTNALAAGYKTPLRKYTLTHKTDRHTHAHRTAHTSTNTHTHTHTYTHIHAHTCSHTHVTIHNALLVDNGISRPASHNIHNEIPYNHLHG